MVAARGTFSFQHAFGTSAAVLGGGGLPIGDAVFGAGSSVLLRDPIDGTDLGSHPAPATVNNVAWEANGGYVIANNGGYGRRLADGTPVWNEDTGDTGRIANIALDGTFYGKSSAGEHVVIDDDGNVVAYRDDMETGGNALEGDIAHDGSLVFSAWGSGTIAWIDPSDLSVLFTDSPSSTWSSTGLATDKTEGGQDLLVYTIQRGGISLWDHAGNKVWENTDFLSGGNGAAFMSPEFSENHVWVLSNGVGLDDTPCVIRFDKGSGQYLGHLNLDPAPPGYNTQASNSNVNGVDVLGNVGVARVSDYICGFDADALTMRWHETDIGANAGGCALLRTL